MSKSLPVAEPATKLPSSSTATIDEITRRLSGASAVLNLLAAIDYNGDGLTPELLTEAIPELAERLDDDVRVALAGARRLHDRVRELESAGPASVAPAGGAS